MTLIELIAAHMTSPAFLRLAPATRDSQRLLYRRLAREIGGRDVGKLSHNDVNDLSGWLKQAQRHMKFNPCSD